MFKSSLAAVLLLSFFFSIPVYSQSSENSNQSGNSGESISLSQNPEDVPVDDFYVSSSGGNETGGTSTLGLIVRMIVVLAICAGCIYAVVYFMKKSTGQTDSGDPFLRKVSQVTLSPGKTVQIVTILDHAYIVGVSDNSVNLLGEITDKEIVDSMNLFADENNNTKKPMSFSEVLDLLLNKKSDGKKRMFDSSFDAAAELKQQRERFNNRGN